ncbi:MAG: GNAT family N-acetyltransferase, partial [Myxococcota bacterium]
LFDSDNRLNAACYAGAKGPDGSFGIVVPTGDPQACQTLGLSIAIRGGARWSVGERNATDSLWAGMGNLTPSIHSDQYLYELTTPTHGESLPLRFATEDDQPWVIHAATEMMKEDFGLDDFLDDEASFHQEIQAGIRAQHELIGESNGHPVFRIKISSQCSDGVQLGGTWVDPAWRGKGVGQAGMRATCKHLLLHTPRITLHVRERNMAAIGCYRATGFHAVQAFRLLSR